MCIRDSICTVFSVIMFILKFLWRRFHLRIDQFCTGCHFCNFFQYHCVMYSFLCILSPCKWAVILAEYCRCCDIVDVYKRQIIFCVVSSAASSSVVSSGMLSSFGLVIYLYADIEPILITTATAPSAVHLANCISTRLSPPRTLCARMIALISASTV